MTWRGGRGPYVLADTTAHARGVVGHHATDHAGVDRGGVWPNLVLNGVSVLLLVPRQQSVDLASDQPRLHCDAATISLQHDTDTLASAERRQIFEQPPSPT